jgi:protein TonB
MPADPDRFGSVAPRERLAALSAVLLVQVGLAIALLSGFRVDVLSKSDVVERLVEIALPKPPPPAPIEPKPIQHKAAAPKAEPAKLGGSPGPKPTHAPPSVAPIVPVAPTVAPSGGGTGTGPALGAGAGGGTGGEGYGDSGDGGTDLEQIAGDIRPSDYPRNLRDAGIGGRVEFEFTVNPNGRVGRCSITRSSGVQELDALTCRLVQQRFVYRPSTDRYGRPIADVVDGEHDWVARRR